METHHIDSIIKKAINESEGFYDIEANNAKERIWNKIQKQKQVQPLFIRLLVAACILLFMGISLILISNIKARNKINTLVEINSSLKNEAIKINSNVLNKKESKITTNVNLPDTVYIEKKVIVTVPLITTKQITDTVYIKQIVYVEKEYKQELLTVNENAYKKDSVFQSINNDYKTEILISNNESIKKEKRNNIKFKFGGNKDQINSGTSAFITKL